MKLVRPTAISFGCRTFCFPVCNKEGGFTWKNVINVKSYKYKFPHVGLQTDFCVYCLLIFSRNSSYITVTTSNSLKLFAVLKVVASQLATTLSVNNYATLSIKLSVRIS